MPKFTARPNSIAMSFPTPLLSFLLLVVAIGAATGANNFIFNDFSGSNLTLSHAAKITDAGLLRLTNCTKEQLGHAFYPSPLHFKTGVSSDSSINSSTLSFSTTFVFAIVPKHKDTFGHGIAFALSPTIDIPGSHPSQYLGLFNETNHDKPMNNIVAVELDTVKNYDVGDINNNHVGIDVNDLTSYNASAAGYFDDGIGGFKKLSLASGESMQVWIEYDSLRKEMSVTISPLNVAKPRTPLLVSKVDLSSILLDDMFVGFSSSTGAATASHYVLGWSFALDGEAVPLDYNKLPQVPRPPKHVQATPPLLAVLVPAAMVVLILMVSSLAVVMVRRRRKFAEILEDWEVEYGPHRFSYKDVYKATDGFNDRNILGAGGFGEVYRGVLRTSKMEVAVKKISHNSRQGMKEFVAEIASMGRLRHRNLVQLLGYCRRRGELILVYDYMANGSLDKFLFVSDDDITDEKGMPVLKWAERFHIVKGVAAGLLYLHEGWEQVVVHRDIKASNVLLDGEMNGKLSDFGLARLYDHGSNPHTTRVLGTFGYLAPELAKTRKATTATDVYAFGSFLLEVACGKRPMTTRSAEEDQILVDWVLEWWNKGSLIEAVDPKMRGEYEPPEVEMVLKLGLMCSHPNAAARPSIRQVVQVLEGEAPMPPATPSDLKASSLAIRRSEGFDDYAISYTCAMGTTLCTRKSVP